MKTFHVRTAPLRLALALTMLCAALAPARADLPDTLTLQANWYQQFDADYTLQYPGEGYAGWQHGPIQIAPRHTALVVMHAWACGTQAEFPGWYRCVEYIPRSKKIAAEVFPRILKTTRAAGLTIYHVVGGGDYFRALPNYLATTALATTHTLEQISPDDSLLAMRKFRSDHVFPGGHNAGDVSRGGKVNDFMPEAQPLPREAIAETSEQLFALCKRDGINHLIYMGFALNACLANSPGGMVDMSRHGILCSVLRQATLAVENRETVRSQSELQQALYRVAIFFGFVFDIDDYQAALNGLKPD